MVDNLFQIGIEKLNKNNFQRWNLSNIKILMGKGYWEFISNDEKELPILKNPTQKHIQANKT